MDEFQRSADLERAAAGDTSALQRLLILYHESLRHVIVAAADPALRIHIDPDDVLQDAYIAAFRGSAEAEFDGPAHFYGWLKQVVLNKLRDEQRALRRQKRDVARVAPRAVGPPGSYADRVRTLADSVPTPSRLSRSAEATAAVITCLAQLDDDQRDVIRLRFLEHVPVSEIAQRLGRTDGAVYGLYTRGLKRLRELMGSITRYLSGL